MSEKEKLPEGWIWTTLGEISLKLQYGWTTKANPIEGTVLLLRTTDISSGTINWDKVPYCTDVPENLASYLLETNDIVISRTGSIGVSYLLGKIPKQTVFASYLVRLHLLQSVVPQYIAYYLQTPEYWRRIHEERQVSSALANISARKLEAIEMPLAPLSEQNSIVAAIEQQFTRLASARGSLQNAQIRAKQYRISLLKSAIEGELTKEWRATHSASETGAQLLKRILTERRARWEEEQLAKMREKGIVPKDEKWKQRYKEPRGSDVENLSELPEGWCWATLGQLADIGTGTTPLRSREEYYDGGTIPWITSKAVDRDFIESAEEFITQKALAETSTTLFPVGTLVMAMYRGGKISELKIEAATNQACAAIVFRPLSFSCQPYVKYFLMGNYFKANSLYVGSDQSNINLALIEKTVIPLPPLGEQNQIVREVEANLSYITELEEMVENNLKRAEHARQSILREAFAGRLVPQDSNDESASILLERVKKLPDEKPIIDPKKFKKGDQKKLVRGIAQWIEANRIANGQQYLGLYETLITINKPTSPAWLFEKTKPKIVEDMDALESFYDELEMNEESGLIVVESGGEGNIQISAVEPTKTTISKLSQ